MQDEVNEKVVALSIRAGSNTARLTASMLKAAMRKYLQSVENAKAKKTAQKAQAPKGKQRYGQLVKQNQGLKSVEITNDNIKSFERVANKYQVDFALKKDKSVDPPRYFVFFKARDASVMAAAFKEFSSREIAKSMRPSVKKRLTKYQQKSQAQHKQREKVKTKERGQEH